ncbi:hypothetical protein N0V84_007901 [Fusarium piperis]|uniref:deuterolysin n=1 Tax=Fusarium piperis TaxID=1435070 RepID=A0A9W9BKW0_9HYPO|nr:hypothetical protein N0V84_007901 [Fusarium piperis]
MYPIPLQIVLRQDESITTVFEAEVYNHNSKKVKVLKFGSFLHDDDVALKVADVFYQCMLSKIPVRFLGVTPLLNFANLDKRDFVEIKSGGSIKVKFDVAQHFDLSAGETFTIEMKGYIPYNSHPVEFKVDRRAAEWTRMKYLDRMPKVLHQNCKGGKWDRENKIRQALSECVHLAGQGKKAARTGPAWRMEEAFGSSSQETRQHVISVFSEAERKCMHDSHKVDQICAEYYGECLSKRKIVTSYLHEPTLQVGYCDEFFWLADIPKKCHSYDSPKAWGWHHSRSSTVVRQMIQSSLRETMGANASVHTEHGLARVLALDVDQSLKNADNYELFVSHYNLDCKAVSPPPPRPASSHHEGSLEQSKLAWGPCDHELLRLAGFKHTRVDCGTLEVPLDHTMTTSRETISLQLVRLNATKSPAKAKSILFNPGGPGASGVGETPTTGQEIHE